MKRKPEIKMSAKLRTKTPWISIAAPPDEPEALLKILLEEFVKRKLEDLPDKPPDRSPNLFGDWKEQKRISVCSLKKENPYRN